VSLRKRKLELISSQDASFHRDFLFAALIHSRQSEKLGGIFE